MWWGNPSQDTEVKRLRTQYIKNDQYLNFILHFLTADSGTEGLSLNIAYDKINKTKGIYLQLTNSSGTQSYQIL